MIAIEDVKFLGARNDQVGGESKVAAGGIARVLLLLDTSFIKQVKRNLFLVIDGHVPVVDFQHHCC